MIPAAVYELQVFNDELYVMGSFHRAGKKRSFNIARWTKSTPTDIEDEFRPEIPDDYMLYQNYPNPFNPKTDISFTLAYGSDVKLEIFNILGQKISTPVNGFKPAGQYTIEWDATDYASGIYLYRLTTDDFVAEKKMLLLK